jgi:hypothetical protein
MTEKQWFSCSVSWSPGILLSNGMNEAKFFASALKKPKTILLDDIESVDSLQKNHPKSFMGCIKIICDD